MFEVTADDIALLNDSDLRTLVRMLSEAELKGRGFSSSHVLAGGAQDASDEGVDVHVELPVGTQMDGFVPRAATVFQVKNTEMPPAKIRKEMRPADLSARPVIQELASQGGAYIIASSESVTFPMRNARLAAMKEAVNDVANRDALHLDYYDRTRLATWVRDHPALAPWIREKVGKSIAGWQPYGAWAYPGEGVEAEYLLDDELRVITTHQEDGEGLGAQAGIEHIRVLLNEERKVVRLVGLSGVGKTRFLQALFDSRVGQHSLSPALALYVNMPDNAEPQPQELATNLLTAKARAILVIDNCTRELHSNLSKVCQAQASKLSLITVEHDVRDDTPEGTEVFRLEPSSVGLIEKLIVHRFPEISQVSVRTIAENSDGNARIAIALAGTVGKNETISALPGEELFRRLFQQGFDHDESLLAAAQAMSLVYSFDGENVSDDKDAELIRLGCMVSKSAQDMYRYTAMLYDRDLIQHRGEWRALLPHALANRLAKSALKSIPPTVVEAYLVDGASARLLRSFSRRLGYLSDSTEALSIAKKWLAPGGMLSNIAKLNAFGKEMFQNIAPVAPEAVLSAIERALLGPDGDVAARESRHVTRLLRLLAYETTMFERCTALLVKIADSEEIETNSHEAARNVFLSLFTLYASGTHATIEQRLAVVRPLLLSPDVKRQSLGLKALGASLEGTHFGGDYDFEFGSRARDHGFWPKTRAEVRHWYGTALNFAAALATSNLSIALDVRREIGNRFRGLWTSAAVFDELEAACSTITSREFWEDGWIGARETQQYDGNGFSPETAARLSSLEQLLRPKDLRQNVLAIVLGDEGCTYELVDVADEGQGEGNVGTVRKKVDATEARVRGLGRAVATDQSVFEQLAAELFTGRGHLSTFGHGLADGSQDQQATWDRLKRQVAQTPKGKLNLAVVCGFLGGVHRSNPELANEFLEKAIEDETLGLYYPILESSFDLDARGSARIMDALSLGMAPIHMYDSLRWGGVSKSVPAKAMKGIVLEIASKAEGFRVAIEVLYMRLQLEKEVPAEIREAGFILLESIPFTARDQNADYTLSKIAKACLSGADGAFLAAKLCGKLKKAIKEYHTHITYYDDFVSALLSVQPKATLDVLAGEGEIELEKGLYLDMFRTKVKLFHAAPEADLLSWCDEKPATRYAALANAVPMSTSDEETKERDWSPIALRLLERAPNRVEVLNRFVSQMKSTITWRSRAAIVESNAKLLEKLAKFPDPGVAALVAQEKAIFAQQIDRLKSAEAERDRKESGRFE